MHGWQAEAAARGGGSRGGRAKGLRRDGEELTRGQSEAEGQAGHLDQHRMGTGCVSDRRVTRDAPRRSEADAAIDQINHRMAFY